jgi:hypothetical protein
MQTNQEIADKALDLVKQGVTTLYTDVQKVAPQVWNMALRQTIVDGVECLIGVGLGAGLIVFGRYLWIHGTKLRAAHINLSWYNSDRETGWKVCGWIAGVTGFLIVTICLFNAIDLLGNPGYWTLVRLIQLAQPNH